MELLAVALLYAVDDNIVIRLVVAAIETQKLLSRRLRLRPIFETHEAGRGVHELFWRLIGKRNRLRLQLRDGQRRGRSDLFDPKLLRLGSGRYGCHSEKKGNQSRNAHDGISRAR